MENTIIIAQGTSHQDTVGTLTSALSDPIKTQCWRERQKQKSLLYMAGSHRPGTGEPLKFSEQKRANRAVLGREPVQPVATEHLKYG